LTQIEKNTVIVENKTKNKQYEMELNLSQIQIEIIKSGGLLNFMSLKNA
jgi:hypothetical protein